VREQLEHDRIIRLLQAKYKRKFDVAINPGHMQAAPVGTSPAVWYPDLVLTSTERGKKLSGVVEVETIESVNNLEAMSQWAAFSRLKAEFHLYVPAVCIDSAKRLMSDLQIAAAELWAYHVIGDQIRFTLMQRSQPAPAKAAPKAMAAAPKAARAAEPERRRVAPTTRATAKPAAKAGARRPAARKAASPARPASKSTAKKAARPAAKAQKRR
jgi:hypothetical protein